MRRFMLAGTASGCGKTTVTCAVLRALQQRRMQPAAFKCGPDYIDPMFHRRVLGTPSYNLDSFFCPPDTLLHLLDTHGGTPSVIEGVMGFYDGGEASAHALSCLTDTPVILIIDCKGMQESVGAVMQGFLHYRTPNRITGFLFNRLPERLAPRMQSLCEELHTGYFGFLPPGAPVFGSRHLGLVTAAEISDLQEKLDALAALAQAHIRLDALCALPDTPLPPYTPPVIRKAAGHPVIACARDEAFCFLYEENLSLLEETGCRLVFFSPLHDPHLPAADGLLLCGGYPELHARTLSENVPMRREIRERIQGGMPVIAECGGFLYLHRTLVTQQGERFPMADVFPEEGYPTGRLGRFGYITMQTKEESLIGNSPLRAHEFHYWNSTGCGSAFDCRKKDGREWRTGYAGKTLYAGFPHLYFRQDPAIARRFADACLAYGGYHGTD